MKQKTENYCFYDEALPEWGIASLLVAEDSQGNHYFQFRPICEALQLQRSKQNAFIQTDSRTRSGAESIKAPTNGGIQETLFLRKRETAIWLAILDPEHVNGLAKGRLEEFQDALWSLADRTVFRKRRSIVAGAEDVGRVVPLTGDLRGEFTCESGVRHVFVFEDGALRVYDR
jgi:hypothetical protein